MALYNAIVCGFVSAKTACLGAKFNPTTPDPIKGSIQVILSSTHATSEIRGTIFVFIPCIFIGGTYTLSIILSSFQHTHISLDDICVKSCSILLFLYLVLKSIYFNNSGLSSRNIYDIGTLKPEISFSILRISIGSIS